MVLVQFVKHNDKNVLLAPVFATVFFMELFIYEKYKILLKSSFFLTHLFIILYFKGRFFHRELYLGRGSYGSIFGVIIEVKCYIQAQKSS